MAKDFYLVLQVRRGASPKEIRSAYRRRARELHPDRSGTGSEPFLELQEAYSVLSDPTQRAAYDYGAESVPVRRVERPASRSSRAEPLRAVEPAGSFREYSVSEFDHFEPSFEELFDRLWSNFDLLSRPKAERLESLTVDIPLPAEQAFAGGSVRLLVPARVECRACHGHGRIGAYDCWRCRGQGAITMEYPVDVPYPGGLRRDHVVRVSLDRFGIHNLYLTVRFRPSGRV